METMSNLSRSGEGEARTRNPQVFFGLAIVFVGLALLFDQIGWRDFRLWTRLWPLLLLLMGGAKLLDSVGGRGRSPRGGLWLIYVGLWGLISEFQLFGLDYTTSWPLLIVAAGLNIVWKSFEAPGAPRAEGH